MKSIDNKLPDFSSGKIPDNELPNFIRDDYQANKKINEYFKNVIPSRYPIQIAFIKKDGEELKVEYDIQKLKTALNRAGTKPIIFVSCIGRYQQGKSTLISGITGNLGYMVGDGNKETTNGVYIDGPYDIHYLYKRFDIKMRKDIYYRENELLSPLIYFFDIEGYDGIKYGIDTNRNNENYIEMITPFLCLSSIFILVTESNPSVIEIKDFFERVKVSNLTTYSNDDDSNGALQLHIVLNKYNKICNQINNILQNVKGIIKSFQQTQNENWIGSNKLRNYGIKHEFYPIIEGLMPYYNDTSFFQLFRYFAKNIVRSIENAAEGNFVRCNGESIALFDYIKQNYREESFEKDIKARIKEEHIHSFQKLALGALNESKNQIFPIIEQKFEEYMKKYSFDININDVKNKYSVIGREKMENKLYSVQDKPNIIDYINILDHNIFEKINAEYDQLITFKKDLYCLFNDLIIHKANQRGQEILESIYTELSNNQNFNYCDEKIKVCIDSNIQKFEQEVFQYKNENNLFLLTENDINEIITNKRTSFQTIIHNRITLDRRIADELEEEIKMKDQLQQMHKNSIINIYSLEEDQYISNLKTQLSDWESYKKMCNKNDSILADFQTKFKNAYENQIEQIINDNCDNLVRQNELNDLIIQRLRRKNQLIIGCNILQSIIDDVQTQSSARISELFETARNELALQTLERKKTDYNYFKVKVEIKTITQYPDGVVEEGEIKEIRIELKQFKELMIGFGEWIKVSCYSLAQKIKQFFTGESTDNEIITQSLLI